MCAKIFDQMDKDGDGNISIKEAVEAMRGAWQQETFKKILLSKNSKGVKKLMKSRFKIPVFFAIPAEPGPG